MEKEGSSCEIGDAVDEGMGEIKPEEVGITGVMTLSE